MTRYKKPQGIIKLNLIIEIVELSRLDVVPVFVWIVYLCDENNVAVYSGNLWNSPRPKFDGHHFGHVAAETIHLFCCPEQEYILHFYPCIRNWIKMFLPAVLNVNAIIKLYCFIPIIDCWCC